MGPGEGEGNSKATPFGVSSDLRITKNRLPECEKKMCLLPERPFFLPLTRKVYIYNINISISISISCFFLHVFHDLLLVVTRRGAGTRNRQAASPLRPPTLGIGPVERWWGRGMRGDWMS